MVRQPGNSIGIAKQSAWVTASSALARVCRLLKQFPVTQSGELIEPGGWDPKSGVIHADVNDQIDLAFANVELALKTAGGKGWSQVFRVNSYHIPMSDDTLEALVRNFKKYMPNHQPIWTCIGVPKLGDPNMKVEIEVVAHDEEGAKAAKAGN